MLALKRSLLFSSGGDGRGRRAHLGESGRGIGRGDVQWYGVLLHEMLLQVEVGFGIRLAYFE
jgi:hypothetical protein